MSKGKRCLVVNCIGAACLLACVQSSTVYPLSLVESIYFHPTVDVVKYHLTYCLVLVLLAIVVFVGKRRIGAFFGDVRTCVVAVMLGILGQWLIAGHPLVADVVSAPTVFGCILVGLGIAGSAFYWSFRLTEYDARDLCLYGMVVLAATQILLAIAVFAEVSQTALTTALLCAEVLCSVAGRGAVCSGASRVDRARGDGEANLAPSSNRTLLVVCIAVLFLIYFCNIYIRLRTYAFVGHDQMLREAVTLLVSAITYGAIAVRFLKSRERSAERSLVLVLSALLIAYLCIAAILQFLDADLQNRVLIAFSHCGEALLWLLGLCMATEGGRSVNKTVASLLVLVGIVPRLITIDLLFVIGGEKIFTSEDILTPYLIVAMVASVVLVVVFLLRFDATAMGSTVSGPQTSPEPNETVSVDEAFEPFSLTARELEVARYIYRGYTAKKISEVLCLSEATIRGYTMRIYRKMGIHSRQELISCIDKRRGNDGGDS